MPRPQRELGAGVWTQGQTRVKAQMSFQVCGLLSSCPATTQPPGGVRGGAGVHSTLTKASRTSNACSLLSGVDTVSPRVMRVRLVRQFIRSGGFTWREDIQALN